MLFALQRIAKQPYHCSNNRQCHGNTQIAVHNGLALCSAIGVELHTGQLVSGYRREAAENKDRTSDRKNRGAKRIERLSKGQAAMRRGRLTKHGDQGVGNHLDNDHTACQHKQCQQEYAIGRGLARWNEQQTARHHRQKAGNRAAHIADFLHEPRAGNADDGISGKETKLHKHRLRVIERK